MERTADADEEEGGPHHSDAAPTTTTTTTRRTPDHPPYAEMVQVALSALAEEGGSTEASISKYIISTYLDLPWGHRNLLPYYLGKLTASRELSMPSPNRYLLAPRPLPPPKASPSPPPPSAAPPQGPRDRGRPPFKPTPPGPIPVPRPTDSVRRGRGRPVQRDPPRAVPTLDGVSGEPVTRPRLILRLRLNPKPVPQPTETFVACDAAKTATEGCCLAGGVGECTALATVVPRRRRTDTVTEAVMETATKGFCLVGGGGECTALVPVVVPRRRRTVRNRKPRKIEGSEVGSSMGRADADVAKPGHEQQSLSLIVVTDQKTGSSKTYKKPRSRRLWFEG